MSGYLLFVSSNPIKSLSCFLNQETLPKLRSTVVVFSGTSLTMKLGPSSMIAISMYQRSGASDISPIQSFEVSIQIRPTLTLWSETYIGCAFINTVIAKTVDPTLLIGKILIRTDDICVGVGLFDWLFLHQDVKMIEYLILIKYQTPLRYSPSLITHITFRHLLSDILHVHYTVHVCSKNSIC